MSSQIQIFFWKKELWYDGSQVSYLAVHEIVDYYWCLWNVEHINIYSDFGIVYEVELWWIGSEWRVNDNMRLTQYCAGPLPFALLPIELPTNALLSTFKLNFEGPQGPGPCRRTDLVVHRFLKCWFCLTQKKDCSIEKFVSLMIKLWSIRKPIDMNHPAATLQCIVRDVEHVEHVYCLIDIVYVHPIQEWSNVDKDNG